MYYRRGWGQVWRGKPATPLSSPDSLRIRDNPQRDYGRVADHTPSDKPISGIVSDKSTTTCFSFRPIPITMIMGVFAFAVGNVRRVRVGYNPPKSGYNGPKIRNS